MSNANLLQESNSFTALTLPWISNGVTVLNHVCTFGTVWSVISQNWGTVRAGEQYVLSFELSGTGTCRLYYQDSTGIKLGDVITLTATPTRYSLSVVSRTSAYADFKLSPYGGTATDITVADALVINLSEARGPGLSFGSMGMLGS